MPKSSRNGFTLAELIVVVLIIVVMIALLLPNVRRVRGAAERTMCSNNLKQIMLAVYNYESTRGRYPSGCNGPGNTPEERLSWIVAVLPYMDQVTLHREFDVEKGNAGNSTAAHTKINSLICPSAKEKLGDAAVTTYIAMAGIGADAASPPADSHGIGFMGYDRMTTEKMITDGTSNTIAVMETRWGLGPWARGGTTTLRGFDPADVPLFGDSRQFGEHESRAHAAFVDGSVRPVALSVDSSKLAAAITIAGKEAPVELD